MFSMNRSLLYFNEIWRNSYKCRPHFLKTEAFPVKFLGTGEVNVVEAESLLEPYLQQFPNVCLEFQVSFSTIINQPGFTIDQSVSPSAGFPHVVLSWPDRAAERKCGRGNLFEGVIWGAVYMVELHSAPIPYEQVQLYALDRNKGKIRN